MRPTPTCGSTTTWSVLSRRYPLTSARPWCCATSRGCRTKRSPRSSEPSSAPSGPGSTVAALCCAAPSPTAHPPPGGPATPGRWPCRCDPSEVGRDLPPTKSCERALRAFWARFCGDPMNFGHLGDRVSALLDGQLTPAEEERAWSHVHDCHQCRDLVEREG